jgi:hypothetical protein
MIPHKGGNIARRETEFWSDREGRVPIRMGRRMV